MTTPVPSCPSGADRAAVVIVLPAEVGPSDAPGLNAGVSAFLAAGHPVVIELGALRRPCLGLVDVLARLQLAGRRLGIPVGVRGSNDAVEELLQITGLADALRPLES